MPRTKRQADPRAGGAKTIYAAMIANLCIAATKYGAALLSGSSAMLSEAIHSSVDTFNQLFLLIGHKRARKAPDKDHPFGYGGEAFFWAFIVAILLFALGCGLSVYEGIRTLLHENQNESGFPWLSLAVLALAFVFEGYSWLTAVREFQEQRRGRGLVSDLRGLKDPSVFVVLFEDTAALLGIVVAAVAVVLAWALASAVPDAVASIVIGIILGAAAITLGIELKGLLIGESGSPELAQAANDLVATYDEIAGVNDLRSLHLGPHDVLLALSLDFEDATTAGRIEVIVTEIERRLRDEFPIVRTVLVEVQSRSGHDAMALI